MLCIMTLNFNDLFIGAVLNKPFNITCKSQRKNIFYWHMLVIECYADCP